MYCGHVQSANWCDDPTAKIPATKVPPSSLRPYKFLVDLTDKSRKERIVTRKCLQILLSLICLDDYRLTSLCLLGHDGLLRNPDLE
jgi:hypothetical protein